MPAPRTGQATAKLFSSVSDRCCRTPRMSRDCLLLVLDLRWVPVQRVCWYSGAGAASLLPMILVVSPRSHIPSGSSGALFAVVRLCAFLLCWIYFQMHLGMAALGLRSPPPPTNRIGGFALASESNMQILIIEFIPRSRVPTRARHGGGVFKKRCINKLSPKFRIHHSWSPRPTV